MESGSDSTGSAAGGATGGSSAGAAGSGDNTGAPSRWTCEACGCHTNTSQDRSCTICGTSNAVPSMLRRHGAAYTSSMGWIARGLRRPEDLDLDEEELWESVVDNMELAHSEDSANRLLRYHSRRLLERSPDATELFQLATAVSYHPRWRPQHPDIQVGDGEWQKNVAHSRPGAGEGRAIRAEEPLPRTVRACGFRVAFDHPAAETGGNMGGCHLIGVTTQSFTAYGEQNGLQQSPFFWGIEDGGQKYEGSLYSGRMNRRSYNALRTEFVAPDAPLNASNVLYGCREVITVICDFDTRTLTFWRDGTLLGTLVTNLPRSGNLYPVAVPFNCGVTVAITAVNEDPLPLLRAFAADCLRVQQSKEDQLRRLLLSKRARLIAHNRPSEKLSPIIWQIFQSYSGGGTQLSYTQAHRLWYQCGLKWSTLKPLIEINKETVSWSDFMTIIGQIIAADTVATGSNQCEVGDKVELVDGYEKYGDATGGPLQPGDRGTVVELQCGANGEHRSIRVIYNGRRWWYQPQAVVSERSGLIDSAATWFIHRMLRTHGYDSSTLESISGKAVTTASWRVCDVVTPKKVQVITETPCSLLGFVVPESTTTTSSNNNTSRASLSTPNRDSGTLLVEFIGKAFPEAVGVKTPNSAENAGIQIRRIRASKLAHTIATFHEKNMNQAEDAVDGKNEVSTAVSVSEKMQADIEAIGRLDQSAIDSIAKECRKGPDAMATLFSAGLPEAVLSAIDASAKQLNSLEPREDLFEKIAGIGVLVESIAERLYTDSPVQVMKTDEEEKVDTDSEHLEENESSLLPSGAVGANRENRAGEAIENDSASSLPQLVSASLQQRRGMLLSLLSRGGRRRETGLNEFGDGHNALLDLDPSVAAFTAHAAPSFLFGSPLTRDVIREPWNPNNTSGSAASSPSQALHEPSFLDLTLRYRGATSEALAGTIRQGGISYFVFIRRLITSGILMNSRPWLESIVDSFHSKKGHGSSVSRQSVSSLRHATDEDGTPILEIAISVGCSADIIRRLLSFGAPVSSEAIRTAANTNQSDTLAILLHNSPLCEGVISIEKCSVQVRRIFDDAKARQDELDRHMRDAAGTFVASVVRKLVALGLSSRRNPSAKTAICSKVVCSILVGDVLLRALQQAQKHVDIPNASPEELSADRSGRVPVDDCFPSLSHQGILRYLPDAVFSEAVFGDVTSATSFLLLLEDYLCSKDMYDAAAGLKMLAILFTHVPQLRSSALLNRYGFLDLISFHDAVASNRIAEILAKEFSEGLEVSSGKPDSPRPETKVPPRQNAAGAVRCPKKHTAVLHITRHSSFRCDICGMGVERGKPMHGCRECDWDACEDCTDKCESGLIKCQAIRTLASDCLRLVSDEEEMKDVVAMSNVMDRLCREDTVLALQAINRKLLLFDPLALIELCRLLQEPGSVTFHQFSTLVLPALHATLSDRPLDVDGMMFEARSRHKSKKARVAACSGSLSLTPDARFEYCREAVNALLDTSKQFDESNADSEGSAQRCNPEREAETSRSLGANNVDEEPTKEISHSMLASELLRRIHQVLSLYEGVQVRSSAPKSLDASGGDKGADIHALSKPIEIRFSQYSYGNVDSVKKGTPLTVHVEPLVPMEDVELHILRSCKLDNSSYLSFCQQLALDSAIVIERSRTESTSYWNIARVVGYDERTGAHELQYASRFLSSADCFDVNSADLNFYDGEAISFDVAVVSVILAAREYLIASRRQNTTGRKALPSNITQSQDPEARCPVELAQLIGTRVESNCSNDGEWNVYTLAGVDASNQSRNDTKVTLISEGGVVLSGVPMEQLRYDRINNFNETDRDEGAPPNARQAMAARNAIRRTFPFAFSSTQRSEEDVTSPRKIGLLKRSWSAISLAPTMRPVEITTADVKKETGNLDETDYRELTCKIGGSNIKLTCYASRIEAAPRLVVKLSTNDKLPPVDVSESHGKTLFRALTDLYHQQAKWRETTPQSSYHLFFAVSVHLCETKSWSAKGSNRHSDLFKQDRVNDNLLEAATWTGRQECRSRKLSARSLSPETEEKTPRLCDGFDLVCLQCMDIIAVLSQHADDNSEITESDRPPVQGFANPVLSKKLVDQLDDPLCVVAEALPDWCTLAPAFCPRAFSFDSRQMLLQRAAFGVSRSTLKQQESKVNVGRLRQRMASLRARAVELMGEAFSGGAEDPTALQLQADELYGMEETLAARVRAAFRAAKWQEYSLQVAKAAVRRDHILSDAAVIMQQYAEDDEINRRRLEVRFEGESGFDAASGDEAGVTRGFYADVAEALLSSETVAGLSHSANCSKLSDVGALESFGMTNNDDEFCALPLWIPDMDTSGQVVIPTPRADNRSRLGIYPRPLPGYHPQLPAVLERFRFMGRLFASAMRDGFMFPLPLSSSFLKLVQHGQEAFCTDEGSCSHQDIPRETLLSSADLPRPGFLGGEVYAAELHICRALNAVDASDPPLSRVDLQRRYQEIAADKNFARIAFGSSYDCSFDDYFQDRVFVDPLDPSQGDDAVPLCAKGHKKSVTIYNIREWVALAKKYILQDGVVCQAMAFREGVEDFFSCTYLRIFTPEEIQRDVCGTGDDVDKWDESAIRKLFKLNGGKGAAEALVAVAAIGGEGGAVLSRRFGPTSPTIGFLVKALMEATPKQRRQFLSFVTSIPIATPGRIEVVPMVSPTGEFLPMHDPTCLPRANTCARRLYLPKFETYDSFAEVLWAVVREESRFKGFYEWRGSG